jgi:thimet oligopeptidase
MKIQKLFFVVFLFITNIYAQREPTYFVKTVQDVENLFPTTVREIHDRVNNVIKNAKREFQNIKTIKSEERTFENTALALDEIGLQLSITADLVSVLELVNPKKEMRDASQKAVLKLNKFMVNSLLDVALYEVYREYVNGSAKKEKLSVEQCFFLSEEIKSFERNGLHLPKYKFKCVKKIRKELAQLYSKYSANIAKDKSSIVVSRNDLKGMDENFIENLERTVDGKYILKCSYPIYFPVLKHCVVEKTRHDLYLIFNNRAYPKNEKILEKIIAKRDKLAKLLGFNSFSAFDLDDQMAKTCERVEEFIIDICGLASIKEHKEFEQLKKDLPCNIKLTNGKLDPWNVAFVKEYYKKKHFNVDDVKISEYFTMEKTVQGMFDIFQKFFGLRFKEYKQNSLWHSDVSVVEVCDEKSCKVIGYIILDLYPRANKYHHACCYGIIPAYKNNSSVSVLIANFPKSTKNQPSLLTHNNENLADVQTLFHEFGHAIHRLLGRSMHKLLSKVEYMAFSRTRVIADFYEMPSQMFEEWVWDKDIIKMISSHYKTGEPLSDKLIDKMIKLKTFDFGYVLQEQCYKSLISLNSFKDGEYKDVKTIAKSAHEKCIKNVCFIPDANFYMSFGSLCCHASKYYGYLWSKIIALDVFYTIKEMGILNSEIGKNVREKILEKGGSSDPETLLFDFLGRESRQDAFLYDYLGIIL